MESMEYSNLEKFCTRTNELLDELVREFQTLNNTMKKLGEIKI